MSKFRAFMTGIVLASLIVAAIQAVTTMAVSEAEITWYEWDM